MTRPTMDAEAETLREDVAVEQGTRVAGPIRVWGESASGPQVERLVYLLRNGCKEGLVWRPEDWPGVTGVNAMLSGEMELEGVWLDLSGEFRVHQRGESVRRHRFLEKHTLKLTKLPCWAHLEDDEYREHIRGLVEMIAEETATMHAANETTPLGVRELQRLRTNQRPANPNRSPKPLVHAASRERRRSFREGWQRFVEAFLAASKSLREDGDLGRHRSHGTRPLGAAKVMARHPHSWPEHLDRSPAPLYHYSSKEKWLSFWNAFSEFMEHYRSAADLLRDGDLLAVFPNGCYTPRREFVPRRPEAEPRGRSPGAD